MAGYSGTPLVQKIGIKSGHRVILRNHPASFMPDEAVHALIPAVMEHRGRTRKLRRCAIWSEATEF